MFLWKIELCVGINVICLLFPQISMLCNSRTNCGHDRIWNKEACQCINFPIMLASRNTEECNAGYYGLNCSQPCRYPNFGLDCQEECHCSKEFCNVRLGCVYENSTSVNHTTIPTQDKSDWTDAFSKEIFIGVLVFCGVLLVYIIYLLTVMYKKKCKSDERRLSSYTGRFIAI